jgi:Helix-turn-helix domain
MLADQFLEAADGARTPTALDDLARKLWRAHAEGHIADADAEAISEAMEGRRVALAGVTGRPLKATRGLPKAGAAGRNAGLPPEGRIEFRVGIQLGGHTPHPEVRGDGDPMGDGVNIAATRREKMFGLGRPRALDRNAKVRIMHWARCLSRRTEKGRAYGVVTAKALAVLEALLWAFHNAKSGLCFPSYEKIADAAHCARSTVAEAIKVLEDAGVLSWVQRIKRVKVRCPDLFGADGVRVVPQRTSNAYHFNDPGGAGASANLNKKFAEAPKSEKPTGTPNQVFSPSLATESKPKRGQLFYPNDNSERLRHPLLVTCGR